MDNKNISEEKAAAKKELLAAIERATSINEARNKKIEEFIATLPEEKAYEEARTEVKRLHDIYNLFLK